MTAKIYVASKVIHARRWQLIRDAQKAHVAAGLQIISTWIDEEEAKFTDFSDLWRRCSAEAAACDYMLVYRESGEVLKGALVEMGIAYGLGKTVVLVGDFDGAGSWPDALDGIVRCADMEQALKWISSQGRT